MTSFECEQMAEDYQWSLARLNACHIGVQNDEMGQIRNEMIFIQQDISSIKIYQQLNLALWSIIGIALIGLVLKKMWGKNNNN